MAWIRTQDREMLVDVDCFYVDDLNPDKLCGSQRGDEVSKITLLGVFPDKEAVLAELDAIERWLEKGAPGVYHIGAERKKVWSLSGPSSQQ
jgi:hypothetical protein